MPLLVSGDCSLPCRVAHSSCMSPTSASMATWPFPVCLLSPSLSCLLGRIPVTEFRDYQTPCSTQYSPLIGWQKCHADTSYYGLCLPLGAPHIHLHLLPTYTCVSWICRKFTLRRRMKPKFDSFFILMFGYFLLPAYISQHLGGHSMQPNSFWFPQILFSYKNHH